MAPGTWTTSAGVEKENKQVKVYINSEMLTMIAACYYMQVYMYVSEGRGGGVGGGMKG